jgi:hypothetical protein
MPQPRHDVQLEVRPADVLAHTRRTAHVAAGSARRIRECDPAPRRCASAGIRRGSDVGRGPTRARFGRDDQSWLSQHTGHLGDEGTIVYPCRRGPERECRRRQRTIRISSFCRGGSRGSPDSARTGEPRWERERADDCGCGAERPAGQPAAARRRRTSRRTRDLSDLRGQPATVRRHRRAYELGRGSCGWRSAGCASRHRSGSPACR